MDMFSDDSSLNYVSILNPLDLTCQPMKNEIFPDIILLPSSLLTIDSSDKIPFKVGKNGELILATLNAQSVIDRNNQFVVPEKCEINVLNSETGKMSVKLKDMDHEDKIISELISFIGYFKNKRIKWKLFQGQVSESLKYYNNFPAMSQSFLSRLEKLDITLKSAQNVEQQLRTWLTNTEDLYKLYSHNYQIDEASNRIDAEKLLQLQTFILDHSRFSSTIIHCDSNPTTVMHTNQNIPRKRRTVFSNSVVKKLTALFQANNYPRGEEVEAISRNFNINQESIMQWFRNQRRKLTKSNN